MKAQTRPDDHRPGQQSGTDTTLDASVRQSGDDDASRADIAAQLRCRRETSRRLPPLQDGRRDPLDPPPRRRPWAYVTVDDSRALALIRGPAGITDALRFLGIRHGWSRGGRGWVMGVEHVPDIEAYAQHRRELVVVHHARASGVAS